MCVYMCTPTDIDIYIICNRYNVTLIIIHFFPQQVLFSNHISTGLFAIAIIKFVSIFSH